MSDMSELTRILFTLEVRSQEQEVGWHYLKRITSRDGVGYGGPQEGRMNLLEEVSRLLNAYARAILASGF
jgi:hypothetical protein